MDNPQRASCPERKSQTAKWMTGELSERQKERADAHLVSCPECTAFVQDMQTLQAALGALPVRRTSPQFEACLAARLSKLNAAAADRSWRARLAAFSQAGFRPVRLAAALATMSAAAVVAAACLHPVSPSQSLPPPSVTMDRSLVLHCLEQHRTDAAAQPLSDISAQTLAAQLDSTPTHATEVSLTSEDGL